MRTEKILDRSGGDYGKPLIGIAESDERENNLPGITGAILDEF